MVLGISMCAVSEGMNLGVKLGKITIQSTVIEAEMFSFILTIRDGSKAISCCFEQVGERIFPECRHTSYGLKCLYFFVIAPLVDAGPVTLTIPFPESWRMYLLLEGKPQHEDT